MTVSSGVNEVVIVSAARTPIGSIGGSLSSVKAPYLGAAVVKAALQRAGVSGDSVGEALFGNVVSAGIGQSPARQAILFAGIFTSETAAICVASAEILPD